MCAEHAVQTQQILTVWKAVGMRVLVVEDELEMGSLLQRGLRAEGMIVDLVTTGEDAVWRATATDYEVIALDVMLPRIDGFEACRRLRAEGTATPVLMLTRLGSTRRSCRRCAPPHQAHIG